MLTFVKENKEKVMHSVTIKCTPQTITQMKQYYQPYLKQTHPPYSEFSAKIKAVTITAYTSGKVLFQGTSAQVEAAKWGAAIKSKQSKALDESTLPAGFSQLSVIGSDENGTGSYLGPVTVAAVYVAKEKLSHLQKMGVKDSKMLDDKKIHHIAKQLLEEDIPHTLITIQPEDYNQIQKHMSQGEMKAKLHNEAIYQTIQKTDSSYDAILIDQFELPQTYFKHIADCPHIVREKVHFKTQGEQYHLAVAAASIIARDAFITELHALSATYGISFPSGAQKESDLAASQLINKYGQDELAKVAKLHFANTQRALDFAQKNK